MGVYTGTVPTFLAAELPSADKFTELSNLGLALTGAWTTWSPTLSNLTLGNGPPVVAKYRQIGTHGSVDYVFGFTLGSTSTVGTEPGFTLPVVPATSPYVNATGVQTPVGMAYYRHASGSPASRIGVAVVFATSVASLRYNNHTTGDSLAQITATVPWTWATGDYLTGWGTYFPA